MTDTIYADVSEWQVPVDDSYPYRVICVRSNDGTYYDKNWKENYSWCRRRADEDQLEFFIVYFVWRPNWEETVDAIKELVGAPHHRMAVMIDVESWRHTKGEIAGDQSEGINDTYSTLADWLGDRRRIIGYGTVSDLDSLWSSKPEGVRIVVASWGSNPDYPGKIAHQYTDGHGHGDGVQLPNECPPFGPCDMNSADGYSPSDFANALGIDITLPAPIADLEHIPRSILAVSRERRLRQSQPNAGTRPQPPPR